MTLTFALLLSPQRDDCLDRSQNLLVRQKGKGCRQHRLQEFGSHAGKPRRETPVLPVQLNQAVNGPLVVLVMRQVMLLLLAIRTDFHALLVLAVVSVASYPQERLPQ